MTNEEKRRRAPEVGRHICNLLRNEDGRLFHCDGHYYFMNRRQRYLVDIYNEDEIYYELIYGGYLKSPWIQHKRLVVEEFRRCVPQVAMDIPTTGVDRRDFEDKEHCGMLVGENFASACLARNMGV